MKDPADDKPTNGGGTNTWKPLLIGGAILGILAACLCIVVLAAVLIDPFHIVARLLGRYDPVSNALPADAPMVISVNLLQLKSAETGELIRTFAKAAGQDDIASHEDAIDEMDQSLEEQYGLTLSEDVIPWVGQYAALALTSIEMETLGSSQGDWLAIIEVRNKKKADAFIEKVCEITAEELGAAMLTISHEKMTIYEADTPYDDERFAIARSKDLVYFGSSSEQVISAMELEAEDSLAEDAAYNAIKNQLPKDRLLTINIGSSLFADALANMGTLQPGMNLSSEAPLSTYTMAVTIVDSGIQMDTLIDYGDQELSDAQLALFESRTGQPEIADMFPDDSYAFFAGTRLDQTWKILKQVYGPMLGGSDFDEALGLLGTQFGLNPDTDLFPYLDGEYALGLFPSTSGFLAQEADLPLGLLLLVESSDDAVLYKLADSLSDVLFMLFEVQEIDSNDLYGYQVFDFGAQDPSFAFAASDDLLLIGTDLESMQSSLSRGNPLTQNPRYTEALDALPEDVRLGMFIDVQSILDVIESQALGEFGPKELEDISAFRPIQSICSGNSPLEGTILHGAVLVIIEK